MEIDEQIKQLQQQKEQLEKQKQQKIEQEWIDKVKGMIGRYYKNVQQYGWRDKINTNRVCYIKVLGVYSGEAAVGKTRIKVKGMNLAFTPVGWSRKTGKLRYEVGENVFRARKTSSDTYQELISGKEYTHEVDTIWTVADDFSTITTGYSSNTYWEECSQQEYEQVEEVAARHASSFYNEMVQFADPKHVFTPETEEMVQHIDEASLKRIDDLLNSGVNVKDLVSSLSGKVAKWNYFNGTTLPELAQYNQHEEDGATNLTIVGGDEGTDYEPYITHYYISSVVINWYKVLYPIRTKLKCTVAQMVEKLCEITEVYSASSWECNYSTHTYDAMFHNAKLKQPFLDKINKTIQENV